jgi:NAD(P)-dependent dehydrogenase (short-subunit alcohol dehydrogenase family)
LQLASRVCLIAGASGAIGAAVTRRFHREGAHLALTYFSKCSDWSELSGDGGKGRVLQFALDIADPKQSADLVEKVVGAFGRLDVLVNCTGVIGPIGPTASIRSEEWVSAINVNLIGSFYLTHAVLPTMLAQSYGKVIHFSGGGAAYARPFYSAYSTSKAALVRFVESLAEELVESHIDINTIAPGPVYSRMWDEMRGASERGGANSLAELKKMEETGGVPPERAADLAAFLACERSNGLTGRLISALHDRWTELDGRIESVMRSEAGTLRRIPLV